MGRTTGERLGDKQQDDRIGGPIRAPGGDSTGKRSPAPLAGLRILPSSRWKLWPIGLMPISTRYKPEGAPETSWTVPLICFISLATTAALASWWVPDFTWSTPSGQTAWYWLMPAPSIWPA